MLKCLSIMGRGKRFTLFAVLLLFTVTMLPVTASAAYYNTYTTMATLNNPNGCNATEGFAVGSTYAYSVKINDTQTKASIYRTNMSDGTTTLMTNGDDGTTYATYLGHANDVVLSTINSEYYMFIVTMQAGSMSLVKLKYAGTTYYKVGNYDITYGGADKKMSGVKILSKDASSIYFLFKSGLNYYKGTLSLTASSGVIAATDAFNIDIVDALVNGSTVPNITSYAGQGVGYYAPTDTIYVPLTYQNVSIVLVYHNISTASGTITSDPNLSFRITSSTYSYLFEIEGVGVNGTTGALWFNCNRKTDLSDIAHDAAAYFNGYSAI